MARDTARARELRNAASPAERLLWAHLSNRQAGSAKFSRQMPVGPYFADFLCREHKLVIELDGYSHDVREAHDRKRDAYFEAAGYRVLRFANADVTERLEGVVQTIEAALSHPQPLPQAGGEKEAPDLTDAKTADTQPLTSRPEVATPPAPDAAGHRARLRQRLIEGGPEALLDHELVEYLLALVTPRVDTKPEAKRLIAEFGSYGALLSADAASLAAAGVSERALAAIKIAQASALRLLKSEAKARPVLASWQALTDYLHADMAHRLTERARVLHLNTRNMLIRDELVSEGSIDQSAIHVREVVRRALELGSAGLILVHNHPSGDPAPSRQDIALTRELIAALKPLGIVVHDHVVIGAQGHASMRALGLL